MIHRRFLVLTLLGVLSLGSCKKPEEDPVEYYSLKTVPHPVAPGSQMVTSGKWLVYLASEANLTATGQDLNGDGDVIDAVAVRVDTYSDKRTLLDTAVQSMVMVKGTLFLVVLESSDGRDWNADGDQADRVLTYAIPSASEPVYLADLDVSSATVLVGVQDSAFFVGADAPSVTGQTNLFASHVASSGAVPDAPTFLATSVVADGDGVSVGIVGESAGVLFLAMDETLDGDLNGDLDGADSSVLALLDASQGGTNIVGTGLALGVNPPFAAGASGSDTIVAFAVNESAQGVNLNNPALFSLSWPPPACTALGDVDTDDDVLHWLLMTDYLAGGAIRNTGLVATPGERLYVHSKGYVACASLEADEGLGAGCDLNGDGDTSDRIFRWVTASNPAAPALPVTDPSYLMALVTTVPGANGDSTGGVLPLGGLWTLLVDEAADGRDHDGDPGTDNNLLAAKDPSLVGQTWNFDHGSGVPIGATWMAADSGSTARVLVAIEESVLGVDQNGDGDLLDSLPTFPKVLSGSALSFPGLAMGVASDNAGIVMAGGVGYFRLSEAEEGGTDFNGDGDSNDFILTRVGVTNSEPLVRMATLNSLDASAVQFDHLAAPKFGVMIFQETMQGAGGKDINSDGDATDYVPRYFRIDN